MFSLAPYCAEFQIGTTDASGAIVDVWPSRPNAELCKASLRRMVPAGMFVAAIALYNHRDIDLYEQKRWLEGRWALGYNLVLKKRPSRQYRGLWDALLIPCQGPITFRLCDDGRWVLMKNLLTNTTNL